jgi:hypothetical protein
MDYFFKKNPVRGYICCLKILTISPANASRKKDFKNKTTELDSRSTDRKAIKGNNWPAISSMTEFSKEKEEEGPSMLLPD